ncbi:ENT3 [[Candida] subhashii]|uniref:ENT3 n=1 Tax=[Candida] subhashii TaxID=561895 RepID=A0A8J5UR95_9ASCO|nr:ENT3 [[Candida] subhashii]KAG7665341.1 ENT3 [[Candida] subhashii]
MDLLKDAAKNLNLYEVKAYVRKAQNVAMNLTEMEAKVREATNNEPWGAPTSLMQQIAAGTYNYREREEIIGFIFRRFTEKAANEWRQIYKSLQLLDYLIKNGAERIIDDIRANMSLIQMLKSFHYIDSKGRDQGINVRNRAKNLIGLLNDDNMIRTERKKSRANSKKFGGVSSAAFGGASSITTGPSYDDDFTNRVYGDGGVYGERYDDPASSYDNGHTGSNNFEEYDVTPASNSSSRATTSSSNINATASKSKSKSEPKKQQQQPEQDLLGDLLSFDGPSSSSGATAVPAANDDDDDDDFDDFQHAPSQTHTPSNLATNLSNLYQPQQTQQPMYGQPQQPQQQQQQQRVPSFSSGPNYHVNTSTGPAKPAATSDAFSSLFLTAKTNAPASSITPTQKQPLNQQQARPVDDDFFGNFSSNNNNQSTSKPSNTNNSGDIDLLSF